VENLLDRKLITITKLVDALNANRYPIEYPPSGKFKRDALAKRIRDAGIKPAQRHGGRQGSLYSVQDVLNMLGYDETRDIDLPDPAETITEAETSTGAWEEYRQKIKERVEEAPSAKVAAEIEKIMTATYKETLDVVEKTGLLLSRAEVQATNERILSVLKQEITQIVGKIASVAPELDRKKLAMIRETIDESLRKAANELDKQSSS